MIEWDRYRFEGDRILFNEYVQGRVKIFFHKNRSRTTEIDIAGTTIVIAREEVPLIIPAEYGKIIIPRRGQNEEVMPIKRPLFTKPFFLVEDREKILGWAEGTRFDLGVAYGLGVSDEELVKDKLDTVVDTRITDEIAKLVFH